MQNIFEQKFGKAIDILKIIENLKTNHAFLIITHRPMPFLICDKIIDLN